MTEQASAGNVDIAALTACVTEIGHRLAEAISQENAALRQRHTGGLAQAAEAKVAAGRAYETEATALLIASDDFAGLDDGRRRELRRVAETLAPLADENARLLKVAVEVNRRFMDAVAEAVRTAAPRAGVYSPSGTIADGSSRGAPTSLAVSLDRAL